MDDFQGRTVFFVDDAELALGFYVDSLGFALDWEHREDGRLLVCQVSLFGLALILDAADSDGQGRAGHGRVFVGLDDAQRDALRRHVHERGIATNVVPWGAPTLVIRDPDANELYFWGPRGEAWEPGDSAAG